MNKNYLSQQLNARVRFKSLLLLTLLAGSASAQQNSMPPIALELPTIPALQAPSSEGAMPSGLDVSAWPSVEAVPTNTCLFTEANADPSRSTWTLRQHATWLLGLKPRQLTHNAVAASLPEVPHVEIFSPLELQPTTAALPQLPDMPTVDSAAPDANMHSPILLVQHNEVVAPPAMPTLTTAAQVMPAAGQRAEDAAPVAHAHQSAPQSLNLRPVIAGPAPALPLEQMTGDSLLLVDVSGIDPSRVVGSQQTAESLIDSFGFRPPTGFSMRDNDNASLAASPSRAQPVSIHEGFAPRVSSANQAAHLDNDGEQPSDRLTVSLPGASQYSISDKSMASSSGPVLNRLSDQGPVHETLGDKDEPTQQKIAGKQLPVSQGRGSQAVEKSFSDKESLLASVPIEVSTSSDKTSRSGKPEVLTPPSRLTKDSPLALPLSSAIQIASTGIEAEVPNRKSVSPEAKLAEPKTQPATDKTVAKSLPVESQPVESLIDGLAPPPSLLTPERPAPSQLATASVTPMPAASTSTLPSTVKVDSPKQAEKITLSDVNPIALKRPVVKAANVAIPDTPNPDSTVVQSSHEMDETGQQTAEFAKMAAKMQQAIKQKFPSCRVKITCNEDGLIAEGHVANNTEASKVLTYVRKTSLCPVADRVTTSQ